MDSPATLAKVVDGKIQQVVAHEPVTNPRPSQVEPPPSESVEGDGPPVLPPPASTASSASGISLAP